jgi:hypothetical protein
MAHEMACLRLYFALLRAENGKKWHHLPFSASTIYSDGSVPFEGLKQENNAKLMKMVDLFNSHFIFSHPTPCLVSFVELIFVSTCCVLFRLLLPEFEIAKQFFYFFYYRRNTKHRTMKLRNHGLEFFLIIISLDSFIFVQ